MTAIFTFHTAFEKNVYYVFYATQNLYVISNTTS